MCSPPTHRRSHRISIGVHTLDYTTEPMDRPNRTSKYGSGDRGAVRLYFHEGRSAVPGRVRAPVESINALRRIRCKWALAENSCKGTLVQL